MLFLGKRVSLFRKKPTVAQQIVLSGKVEDELTTITKDAIAEGKRSMRAYADKRIKGYNAATNPLGVADAKKILLRLIREAVANRQNINGDIERSISEGGLYRRYYNKVAVVNDMTNETYSRMEHMKAARERFEYKKKVYNNVTGHMYLERAVRAVQPTSDSSGLNDIGDEIDKEGAKLDGQENFD